MSKLLVIVGSTRPGRAADRVLPWLSEKTDGHPAFDTEIVDLRDWPLPIFGEHAGTIGDLNDPTYSEPLVKAWNAKVKSADAYVILTPEYNHSIPGGLKNAIDTVWLSFGFRNKPVAFVGYSGGIAGGVRAIEHLAHVFVETESVPLRNSVVIPAVHSAFDENGRPVSPVTNAAADIMLEDLAWWSAALEQARAAGELSPGLVPAARGDERAVLTRRARLAVLLAGGWRRAVAGPARRERAKREVIAGRARPRSGGRRPPGRGRARSCARTRWAGCPSPTCHPRRAAPAAPVRSSWPAWVSSYS